MRKLTEQERATLNRGYRAPVDDEPMRRNAYLQELARRRIDAAGASADARTMRNQAVIYKLLGLDLKAGFNGAPPAFLAEEEIKVSGGKSILAGIRSVAKNPLAVMRAKGQVTAKEYFGGESFCGLLELSSAIDLKGFGFDEYVDGGGVAGVSLLKLEIAQRHNSIKAWLSGVEYQLLTLLTIEGMSIAAIARTMTFGSSTNTVSSKVHGALDRSAEFFGYQAERTSPLGDLATEDVLGPGVDRA